ncbi:MAG: hypothetical protein ACRDWD_16385 [Acidimicrobiia bacterium]
MHRIDSAHSVWLFDTDRMRFRRLPKGSDPSAPSLERDWQRYYALVEDAGSGAFTVALNEDRTRLLRSLREPAASADDNTAELTLAPVDDQ